MAPDQTFHCFLCNRFKPVAEVKFRRDSAGRNRRICSNCFKVRQDKRH